MVSSALVPPGHLGGYDFLKVKPHESRSEQRAGTSHLVLSFGSAQHVKVSPTAHRIIEVLDGAHRLTDLPAQLAQGPEPVHCTEADLRRFVDEVLVPRGLLEGTPSPDAQRPAGPLWVRLPLVRTERFAGVFGGLRALFSWPVATVLLGSVVACGALSLTRLSRSPVGLDAVNSLAIIVIAYLSFVLHEAGHVIAAHRFGISTGVAGVGLFLFTPVFFVDLTNAWRLPPRQRVVVDLAGMYVQSLVVLPLVLAGELTQDRQYHLMALSILLVTSFNLLPLFKLDGYWAVCDALGFDNLSTNAVSVVRAALAGRGGGRSAGYVVASFVYATTTAGMIALGLVMVGSAVGRRDTIASQTAQAVTLLIDGQVIVGLQALNQVFIVLVPPLFLVIVLGRFLVTLARNFTTGLIRGIHQKREEQTCSSSITS